MAGDFDNVVTLGASGGSAGELAIDLLKWAESGDAVDLLVVIRAPDGALGIQHTPLDSAEIAEIAEMAAYLNAHSQHTIWTENQAPRLVDEEDQCDED